MSRELSEFEERIIANVEQYGCHVNSIFDPDDEDPPFCYTVGLPHNAGHPDVIVFGLNPEIMHYMLNEVLAQCLDGLVLEDGSVVSGLLDGFDCIAREVPADKITDEHFASALWFEDFCGRPAPSKAFQIVWPGASNGLFPWDEQASDEVRSAQPPLYMSRSVH